MISPLRNSGFLQASPESTRGTLAETSKLRISETFVSRQGEGALTGTNSFFVRTSGCNLRCWFCDTPYASWRPEGDQVSIADIVQAIEDSGVRHVVLTGGEPLLPKESVLLCEMLRERGHHITIETAGTIARDVACDLMSISPKFRTSAPDASEHPRWSELHEQRRMPIATMQTLIEQSADYQVKFVVDGSRDLEELQEIVAQLGVPAEKVWVMPQGVSNAELDQAATWLRPWTAERGFQYCDRMQIRWYGNRRGT
ncbi:7-carboxy-7-deazaguanine synthase QueE [Novipirellula caenicola]|uniref:7-carboxy-7-deazaguanine synthase QueE n=1 Tax=Novipirellula caenicola TaxID=1536901 RepID=UPI0031E786DA